MEKFLEIVYSNQLADSEKGDEYIKIFAPLMEKLKDTLSEKLYDEVEELFTDCGANASRFYAVEGMKLAIGIMNGTYIPTM
jgi:hypothetical protein